jgi:hypothetical protein
VPSRHIDRGRLKELYSPISQKAEFLMGGYKAANKSGRILDQNELKEAAFEPPPLCHCGKKDKQALIADKGLLGPDQVEACLPITDLQLCATLSVIHKAEPPTELLISRVPAPDTARQLVAQFHAMIRTKAVANLIPLIMAAEDSFAASFAKGIAKD